MNGWYKQHLQNDQPDVLGCLQVEEPQWYNQHSDIQRIVEVKVGLKKGVQDEKDGHAESKEKSMCQGSLHQRLPTPTRGATRVRTSKALTRLATKSKVDL
jgi:hypothetical protein